MGTSNFYSRLMPIIRPFLLATKRFLYSLELPAMPFKVPGISNFVTVTGSQQATDSNIQAHRLIASKKSLNVSVIYQQGNVPSPTRVKFDCNSGWGASFWQWATPLDRQRLLALSQEQRPILPRKRRASKLSTSSIVPLFEVGIFRSTCEEIAECLSVDAAVPAAMVHNSPRSETASLPAFSKQSAL